MLVHIVPVGPGEFLKYFLLVVAPHFFLVGPIFHSAVDLVVNLTLQLLRHISMFFELAQTVHVVLFVVELEWVEAFALLLVVDFLGAGLLLDFALSLLQLVIDGLEHLALLLSLLPLLLLRVDGEEFVGDQEELPQVHVLCL